MALRVKSLKELDALLIEQIAPTVEPEAFESLEQILEAQSELFAPDVDDEPVHSSADALVQRSAEFGNPESLVAQYEQHCYVPLAFVTTVIGAVPACGNGPVVNTPHSRLPLRGVCSERDDPVKPEPPRWLWRYALWSDYAQTWERGGRGDDASRCRLTATRIAFDSVTPSIPLLTLKG